MTIPWPNAIQTAQWYYYSWHIFPYIVFSSRLSIHVPLAAVDYQRSVRHDSYVLFSMVHCYNNLPNFFLTRGFLSWASFSDSEIRSNVETCSKTCSLDFNLLNLGFEKCITEWILLLLPVRIASQSKGCYCVLLDIFNIINGWIPTQFNTLLQFTWKFSWLSLQFDTQSVKDLSVPWLIYKLILTFLRPLVGDNCFGCFHFNCQWSRANNHISAFNSRNSQSENT